MSATKKTVRPVKKKETRAKKDLSLRREVKIPPIVAIGASAGGLEAFKEFFTHMPKNSGAAFVVISHLDPDHVSILPELLQKYTEMEVHKLTSKMVSKANTIYVISPSRNITIANGILQPLEQGKVYGARLPIDFFFSSLAKDQGSRAICIVLSGTGADGTLGLREIKAVSGMVMAQDEKSAKYSGMFNRGGSLFDRYDI